ncbi:MAG: DUF4259 domain-containing protein [Bacteroidetes bacterium]|nr:DUF4259 domain-containing protein [Bacteroidota bacterium]
MSNLTISNFDTETAAEFISDVSLNGYGLIAIAIDRMNEQEVRQTLTDCEETLVAAELIAAAIGRPSLHLPEDAREWVATFLPTGSFENDEITRLADNAADAIDKIVADSELRDMWEGNPDFDEWFQLQVDLQQRILGNED